MDAARPTILPTHTAALFEEAVDIAARALGKGEVVAVPTETVYGLAANAWDPKAVARIYEVKGRPAQNPIIVHVADLEMAKQCVTGWPLTADRLARAFWPGPLTIVLPKSEKIPSVVTANGPTVAVRWPSHPFIQAVIRKCGFPLAAPSANPSNQISPTSAQHVSKSLGNRIRIVVDGGQSHVGIESTVVDLTTEPVSVLRPGMVHRESVAAVLQMEVAEGAGQGTGRLRSPGQLPRHYSPKAKLIILEWQTEDELKGKLGAAVNGRCYIIAHKNVPLGFLPGRVSVIPHDAEAFARAIYAELHRCDDEGAELIVVERLPDGPEWRAISDRLRRAAA